MKVELYLYPERKLRECANQLSTSGRVEIISSQICANGGSGKVRKFNEKSIDIF